MMVEIEGVSWNVQVDGNRDAEPLLLLHGFTGDLHTWDAFVSDWGRFFHLIRLDCIGHGLSEKPIDLKPYKMESAVAAIARVLDHFDIERTHVLGYSMGGRLALSFAMMHPERLHSLILESSSPGLHTESERKLRSEQDHELAQRILNEGIPAFVEYWEQLPLFQSQRMLPQAVQDTIRTARLQNEAIGLANSLRGMGTGEQPSWWEHLSKCRIPTLLIAGEHDSKYCVIAQEMKQMLQDCVRVVIPDAGHTPHVEQTEIFGTIVLDYLRSNRRRT